MKKISILLMLLSVFFVGCNATTKGAGVGAVVGAGLGYAIGHQSDHGAAGAAIGGGAGAIAGGLIGNKIDTKKFCPECGRRFTTSAQYCPYDGAVLKSIN